MVSLEYKLVVCLLLLTVVRSTSVEPKQIIYVDEVNGIDSCCWENRNEFLCSSEKVALDDVELHNSTLVVVKPKCMCKEFHESAATAPHDPQYRTWFFPDPSIKVTHVDVGMTFMMLSECISYYFRIYLLQ